MVWASLAAVLSSLHIYQTETYSPFEPGRSKRNEDTRPNHINQEGDDDLNFTCIYLLICMNRRVMCALARRSCTPARLLPKRREGIRVQRRLAVLDTDARLGALPWPKKTASRCSSSSSTREPYFQVIGELSIGLPADSYQRPPAMLQICKRLTRFIVIGYLAVALSYTTVRLCLGLSRNLSYVLGSCFEPPSSITWTSDRAIVQTNNDDTWSRDLFESKLFDLTLKPSKVIPYYYRALQEHKDEDVTITTIVTSSRFETLARLVEQYRGPISATVHISSSNTTRRASLLASLHSTYTSSPLFARWVDVHLVTDAYDRQFNMWRNVARLHARTEWVIMLDVDFAVCTNIRERFRGALEAGGAVGTLAKSGRAAFVIPAFEYVVQEDGKDWKTFPRNKQALVELVHAGSIATFHQSWAPGHNSTDYEQYYAALPGEIYRVTTYQKSYEPYVVMRRDGPPWCDERFVGYGGNKAACLFSIYLSGIDFYVLPDDFLIHQSHAYAEETRKSERKTNRQVYDNFRKELCVEQIAQSLRANMLHTDEKHNLRVECMRTPGVPEIVLEHLLKTEVKKEIVSD